MTTVSSLLKARIPGEPRSLHALAVALAGVLTDTPPPGSDPLAVLEAGDTSNYELSGTWQEVRAARDFGELSPVEYDYLAATVEALTMEADG